MDGSKSATRRSGVARACASSSRSRGRSDGHAAICLMAAGLALSLVAACRSVPRESASQPAATQCRDLLLDSLGDYALGLRQQDDAALTAEKERLESAPQSPERDLRLALLLGQHTSPLYDPGRASRLLARLSSESESDSVHKALAEMLYTSLPGGPRRCADSDEVRELAAQLSVEQQRHQETSALLEDARQQLEAERAQRARLEQQLGALKSLEEQIKNRDNESGR